MAKNILSRAKDGLIGFFKSKPSDLADKYYPDLAKAFKEDSAVFAQTEHEIKMTEFLNTVKTAMKTALVGFEADKDHAKLAENIGKIKTNAAQRLHPLHQQRMDKCTAEDIAADDRNAITRKHSEQINALAKYFADIEAYLDSIQKLGAQSDYGYRPAHEERDAEPKEKLATIKGDKTPDPRKKDPGMDMSKYSVPVHFDKKNGQFTFYNVEETKPEDARRAVDALAEKGFTGIKITGQFKDDIKQEMWMRAQCKNPPLKVDGYIPTDSIIKARDEFRQKEGLPSIDDLNKKAGVKAKKAASQEAAEATETAITQRNHR